MESQPTDITQLLFKQTLSEADLATRELSVVLPNWSVEPVGVYAVWPSNAPKDGLVKRFIEFLVTES